MAAKTRMRRCVKVEFRDCRLLVLLTLCLSVTTVHSATTTTPVVTTLPPATTTTVAPTTTTQVQTTTTIAPAQPRSQIPVQTDIGLCGCDLTGNECDVNCCCDPECTEADKSAFVCSAASIIIDNKLCSQQQLYLFVNSPYPNNITDDGLFCIYYDNYADRNYYTDPDFIQSVAQFDDYVNTYAQPSFETADTSTEPEFTFNSFYSSGDPIYVIYPSEARGYFSVPQPLTSSRCSDQTPLGYLQEQNTECVRLLSTQSLATECTAEPSFNSSTFYEGFRVVTTPALFGYVENGTLITITTTPGPVTTTTPTTTTTIAANATTVAPVVTTTPVPTIVDPALVQSIYINPYTLAVNATIATHLCRQADGSLIDCPAGTVLEPSYDTGTATCSNVVEEARYTITTDGTNGISQMSVQFVFRDITALPVLQRTSVSFVSASDVGIVTARSGNPGYVVGKPVIYGELISNQTADGIASQHIRLNEDSSRWLTVVRAGATGECVSSPTQRKSVDFGVNIRSGCTITLNTTTTSSVCETIQTRIVQALEGPDHVPGLVAGRWVDNNRYVATFGNTDIYKVGDWVKVIVDGRPTPSDSVGNTDSRTGPTCSLKMGVHIQVLYGSVGALANPQSKILGVAFMYDSSKDVVYRCVGAYCQDGTAADTQTFEVSQTVSFLDISQPAVKIKGDAPIFIARVPNDFFYPFLYDTSGAQATVPSKSIAPVIFPFIVTFILVKSIS